MSITIDNTNDSAVTGQWSNPGAPLYDRLLAEPNYKALIKEAYLIAPVAKIQNDAKDPTSFSASGVGYPHHVIRNGKLVIHRRGVIAAYSRAQQQGIFDGEVKAHLLKHYKELGLYKESTMEEETELKHYGVLGMKWGIRRDIDPVSGKIITDKSVTKERLSTKKSIRTMSTTDIKEAIDRLQNEKKLRDLIDKDVAPGRTAVNDVLTKIGVATVTTVGTAVATYTVKAAMQKKFEMKEAATFIRPKK